MPKTETPVLVGTPYAGIAMEIAQLHRNLERQVITQDEYDEAKARLLDAYPSRSQGYAVG